MTKKQPATSKNPDNKSPLTRLLERRIRPTSPHAFAENGPSRATSTVVVCAGDSITHGFMSANYVRMLHDRIGETGYAFINAGWTGDLAWNLGQRLNDVIACKPDVVTVLIGTNDTAALINDSWRDGYVRDQHLPQHPSSEWYRQQLTEIVQRLKDQTTASVVLLTIPPIGEDLHSRTNLLVQHTNDVIAQVGGKLDVPILPLHQRLARLITSKRVVPAFDETRKLMLRSMASRLLIRRTWNQISDRTARTILTDDIHLNERGASVIAELIEEYLRAPAT